MFRFVTGGAMIAALLFTNLAPTGAATITAAAASISVNVISRGCSFGQFNGVDFGATDVSRIVGLVRPLQLSVTCDFTVDAWTIFIPTSASGRLINGNSTVPFTVFKDAATTTPLGILATDPNALSGTGAAAPIAYVKLNGIVGPTNAPGIYSGVITLNILG